MASLMLLRVDSATTHHTWLSVPSTGCLTGASVCSVCSVCQTLSMGAQYLELQPIFLHEPDVVVRLSCQHCDNQWVFKGLRNDRVSRWVHGGAGSDCQSLHQNSSE